MRDQHRRAGILEHEGQALARVIGIERQIGAAGLQDADETDQHRGRTLHAQTDRGLGADAERAEMMRQLIGARIELGIAQGLLLEDHRDGLRGTGSLRGKQLR